MFSKEINIKQSDIPPEWSIEAADLIIKVRNLIIINNQLIVLRSYLKEDLRKD